MKVYYSLDYDCLKYSFYLEEYECVFRIGRSASSFMIERYTIDDGRYLYSPTDIFIKRKGYHRGDHLASLNDFDKEIEVK